MLSENIKTIRKAKGLSQEELAVKLNVVRQTISKWEQGLSVPDSGSRSLPFLMSICILSPLCCVLCSVPRRSGLELCALTPGVQARDCCLTSPELVWACSNPMRCLHRTGLISGPDCNTCGIRPDSCAPVSGSRDRSAPMPLHWNQRCSRY